MPSCSPSPTLRSQRTPPPKHFLNRNMPARMTYIPDDTLMPPPFSQLPYDPQLEVQDIPPSSLVPIAHFFIPEQRNFTGYVRLAETERARHQEQLAIIALDTSDRLYPLAEQPRVSPASTFNPMSPSSPEDGPFPPLISYPDTHSLDGALGFVPQVNSNCYHQSFVEYPLYSWGNTCSQQKYTCFR
jgi:hypothetical protein